MTEPRIRIGIVLVLALCVACKPAAPPSKKPATAGPQVRATVVTIRTTVDPPKQTTMHSVVIAGDLARSTDELDVWRLFDVKKGTVTFVDEIAKTSRTEPIGAPQKVTLPPTGRKQPLLGVEANESLIQIGAYRRELWIAKHPAIPDRLYSMLQPIGAPPGFPLLDRTNMPYGKASKFVVERVVVAIGQKDVPKALFEVPRGYRDLTKPAANRRSAS